MMEDVEADHWAALLQPENLYGEACGETQPEPRERSLRGLRARLGWVNDELNRRTKRKKPTKRQRKNLLMIRKIYKRQSPGGVVRSRNLRALKEKIAALVRIRMLQAEKTRKKAKGKRLEGKVVRVIPNKGGYG